MRNRFHLEKYHRTRRYKCPACGRPHCYARYVDSQGEIELPMECGRCDHEVSCGYHRPPREFLEKMFPDPFTAPSSLSLPMERLNPVLSNPASTLDDIKRHSSMPEVIVQHSMQRYEINPLYLFLSKRFGKEGTLALFREYGVGTSQRWGGATVFWQRDIDGIVRTGKIMGYDPETGHRVKNPRPLMQWAHCLIPREITTDDHSLAEPPHDFQLRQCYFGEHLLGKYPEKEVAIVESEKTALIASVEFPKIVWIATGGLSNLRPTKALAGRDVILIPDCGAEDRWQEKMLQMHMGVNSPKSIRISRMLSVRITPEQRSQGWDLADLLLQGRDQ